MLTHFLDDPNEIINYAEDIYKTGCPEYKSAARERLVYANLLLAKAALADKNRTQADDFFKKVVFYAKEDLKNSKIAHPELIYFHLGEYCILHGKDTKALKYFDLFDKVDSEDVLIIHERDEEDFGKRKAELKERLLDLFVQRKKLLSSAPTQSIKTQALILLYEASILLYTDIVANKAGKILSIFKNASSPFVKVQKKLRKILFKITSYPELSKIIINILAKIDNVIENLKMFSDKFSTD